MIWELIYGQAAKTAPMKSLEDMWEIAGTEHYNTQRQQSIRTLWMNYRAEANI